jgi:hypothetical protein
MIENASRGPVAKATIESAPASSSGNTRARRIGWAVLPLVCVGTVLVGCPTPATRYDLEIQRGSQVEFSYDLGAGFFDQDFEWNFGALADVPNEALQAVEPETMVQFGVQNLTSQTWTPSVSGAAPITLTQPYEVQLFTYEPGVQAQDLLGTYADPGTWESEVTTPSGPPPWYLPNAVSMPFPPPPGYLSPLVLGPVLPYTFWAPSQPANWVGPGNAPVGTGSIKDVRLFQRGMCSVETPIQPILDQLTSELHDTFLHSSCSPGETTGSVTWIHAVTNLPNGASNGPSKLGDVGLGGGFSLNARLHVEDHGIGGPIFSLDPCDVTENYIYLFGLTDGLLNISSQQVNNDATDDPLCDGFLGNEGFDALTETGFNTSIPTAFATAAQAAQTQDFSSGSDDYTFACDPTVKDPCGTPFRGTGLDGEPEDNLGPIVEFTLAIAVGAGYLGITDVNAVNEMEAAASNPADWNCMATYPFGDISGVNACAPVTPQYRCLYTARAKRINVMPDAVELVWFDAVAFDDPMFAVFVASFEPAGLTGAAPGVANKWQKLCGVQANPPQLLGPPGGDQDNYFTRSYAVSKVAGDTCEFIDTRGLISCPCKGNSDCNSNECNNGVCSFECETNFDCQPGQTCYGGNPAATFHLCGGAGSCDACHPWEKCTTLPSGMNKCVPLSQ